MVGDAVMGPLEGGRRGPMAAGLLVAGGPLAVPSQAKLNEGLLQDGPRALSGRIWGALRGESLAAVRH